jgi:hypothetical protein
VTASLDELWLRSFQALTTLIAHDLKGALNGVSVNLEVVRTRSQRESSTGADVHKFAVSAADQLGSVIRSTTSLLSLGRPARGPVEVSAVARQVTGLLADMKAGAGGKLEVVVEGGLSAETSAPLSAVRLVIAEALVTTLSGTSQVAVRVRGLPTPTVLISPAQDPGLPPDTAAALKSVGISLHTDGHGISIAFPGPAEFSTEDA